MCLMFLLLRWTRTFPTQSTVNEISRLSEEWAQVKIFTVWCFYSVILYVGAFVETWPSVNVPGAVCSVHHVRYSQIHQQGFMLSCGPENDTRDDTRSVASSVSICLQTHRWWLKCTDFIFVPRDGQIQNLFAATVSRSDHHIAAGPRSENVTYASPM